MLSLWPCLGTTGSHGNSDGGGGGLCQTVRLGSKPTGSLSFNLEAHAADNLPQHCVLLCYCVMLLVSRQKYHSQAVLNLQSVS